MLPDSLNKHYQFPDEFCAASGFECIAKLHGFIGKDEFPLQTDKKNLNLGFGKNHTTFLSKWLNCNEDQFDTASAMALIEKETNEGRFPLISLYEWNPKPGWHIFLLLSHGGKLLLVDPRNCSAPAQAIKTDDKTVLADFLENNRVKNPERKTLHMLWYDLKANPSVAF